MVRKAERKDIPRIAEIIIFGKRVAYRKIFQNDDESFNHLQVVSLAENYEKDNKLLETMLVYDDGIVKGVISGQKKEGHMEICDFYVEPFFLGQGIGTQMLHQLMQEATQQKIKLMYLWVVEENSKARRFYERNGFQGNGRKAVIEGTDKMDVYYERLL